MNYVRNKLRVVHFPEISLNKSFKVEVENEEQAFLAINIIANHHLWLNKNDFIGDYSNLLYVEMYDESIDPETKEEFGWVDYFNEIDDMDWHDVEKLLTSYLVD